MRLVGDRLGDRRRDRRFNGFVRIVDVDRVGILNVDLGRDRDRPG